jgi:hypothetical protein
MKKGEFRLVTKRKPRVPPFIDYMNRECPWTEEVFLLDDRFPPTHAEHIVLRAHCFRLADGNIGASGQIDPKEILIRGVNYRQLDPANSACELCENGHMIPLKKRFFNSTYRPNWPLWKTLWRRLRAMMGP